MLPSETLLTASQIAEAQGVVKRAVEQKAKRNHWPYQTNTTRGGQQRLYRLADLPMPVRQAVVRKFPELVKPSLAAAAEIKPDGRSRRNQAPVYDLANLEWLYNKATFKARERAERRQRCCVKVQAQVDLGTGVIEALASIAQHEDVPMGSLRTWYYTVKLAPREHWTLLLLDNCVGRTAVAEMSPGAWASYCAHFLNRRAPSHESAYRRVQDEAAANGWVIPCGKTFIRRMDREVDVRDQTRERFGDEAAARLYPSQERDVSVFHAGQAVNGDGLKFDKLWVRHPDGEVLNTTTGWFYQDIYSRRMLAFELGKTENTDLFRRATYKLTGITLPEEMWLDNTVVAANKAMTAGANGRHRFKDMPDDFKGALVQLGVNIHFTLPNFEQSNPGAKPIERAFGIGGLHSEVANCFVGRGYSKETAIEFAELQQVVTEEVARFNARKGRDNAVCRGKLSYDDAWAQSLTEGGGVIRKCSEAQRSLLLLMPEVVTVNRKTAVIAIKAGLSSRGKNRYHDDLLYKHCGEKVVVYYDPERLSDGVHVYAFSGRYLCRAEHLQAVAFNSMIEGREWAKSKARALKGDKIRVREEQRMRAMERSAAKRAVLPPMVPDVPHGAPMQNQFKRVIQPARDARLAKLPRVANSHHEDSFVEMFAPRAAAPSVERSDG